MKEQDILSVAGQAFAESRFAGKVNPRTGVNYNRWPFTEGFLRGVRFYATHLSRKPPLRAIRSISETKDADDTGELCELEKWEVAITNAAQNYRTLRKDRDDLAAAVRRLNDELSKTKARHLVEKARLEKQIKDLEYYLVVVGRKEGQT